MPSPASPLTVRMTPREAKRLAEMATKSGMTRHRYMYLVLLRAMDAGLVIKESVQYTETKKEAG